MARMAHTNREWAWNTLREIIVGHGPTEPAFTCVHFSIKWCTWASARMMRECACSCAWAPTPIVDDVVVVQSSLFMLELSGVQFAHWIIRSVFLFHSFRSCCAALPGWQKKGLESELNVGTFIANSMETDGRMVERTKERKKERNPHIHAHIQSVIQPFTWFAQTCNNNIGFCFSSLHQCGHDSSVSSVCMCCVYRLVRFSGIECILIMDELTFAAPIMFISFVTISC